MSLPSKAIDRLFERLAATYGAAWTRQWADVPIADVKSVWAHELAGYTNRLEALAWALENLPERCPNAIEFRNICRNAPAPAVKPLPMPKADPERVKAELAKLGHVSAGQREVGIGVDHKAWARGILSRHEAGEKLNPTTLRFAREALRMHLMPGVA